MGSIFKAYDIRGIYGTDLTEDLAYKIGRAFATFVKCNKVVVGRDMRPHSEPLFRALAKGLNEQGADEFWLWLEDLGRRKRPHGRWNGMRWRPVTWESGMGCISSSADCQRSRGSLRRLTSANGWHWPSQALPHCRS